MEAKSRFLTDEGVEVETLEVPGVLVDSMGHSWTIPSDSNEDYSDLLQPMPLNIPNRDPNFHYQGERYDKVSERIAEGFAVVTRDEVGLPDPVAREYGQPVDNSYRVGDTVIVKIPKVLAERRQRAYNKLSKSARDSVGPTDKMLREAREKGVVFTTNRQTNVVDEELVRKGKVERE